MSGTQAARRFDAAAYLACEERQAGRHEFVAGEVFARVGVRQAHNVATLNLAAALRRELAGSRCRVFVESVKVRIEAADCFFYPDVSVTCDARDRLTPEYISHPLLICEVLSESTAAVDRGGKFAAYRRLDSLREYLLLDLAAQHLEVYRRNAENHWLLYEYRAGGQLALPSLAATLTVDELLADTEEEGAAGVVPAQGDLP